MSDSFRILSVEEQKAIAALKRLAKRWPKTLWLASMSGTLSVMALGPTGEREYHPVTPDGCGGGLNAAYRIDIIDIPNDGGDW